MSESIDIIDKWLRGTRDKLYVREVESLRKIGYIITAETKALKEEMLGMSEIDIVKSKKIISLEQIRDELLELASGYLAYVSAHDDSISEEIVEIIKTKIQRAEQQKVETK